MLTMEDIARIAHEVNKGYCESQGDFSQVDWDAAPEWQKNSSRAGVRAHLAAGGRMTPEDSHRSWMNQKLIDGWKFGPVKDEVQKTHPCMVPYAELPATQRAKDYIFKAVVDSVGRTYAGLTRRV